MLGWFDRSPWIRQRLGVLSETLAAQRGLPIIFAIALTVISFLVQGLGLLAGSVALLCIGSAVLHIGIMIGLVGLLVAVPLGKG